MVADPLRDLARRRGPRRALVDRTAGFWVSWFDLDGLADAWAGQFEAHGVQPGDRVAVVEPAGVRFASLLHACLRIGAALVPISTATPDAEVQRVLADCRPRLLVREGEIETMPGPVAGPEGDACVLYTSGTTGEPKGVRLTVANHAASAAGCLESLDGTERDRWLLVLAPHHVGGLTILMRSVLYNQAVISLARFEEQPVLEAMETEHPTLISVVPTMLTRMLAAGGLEALRRARAILVGGGPAPADQVRGWAELGLSVCPTYGLTETCSQVAIVPAGRADELAGSAGLVGSHAEVEIVRTPGDGNPHGSCAGSTDLVGEIVVSGPAVSPGYLNPALEPQPRDGRFATGDLGRLDGGVLTVVGRRDDTINTGGENVRPEEVEAVLSAHPGVREAAVAGLPDVEWGQLVAAWVVAGGVTEAELRRWAQERLPGFKVPRRWRFVDRLPTTEGGKLVRRRLVAG